MLRRLRADGLIAGGRVYGGGLHKLEPRELVGFLPTRLRSPARPSIIGPDASVASTTLGAAFLSGRRPQSEEGPLMSSKVPRSLHQRHDPRPGVVSQGRRRHPGDARRPAGRAGPLRAGLPLGRGDAPREGRPVRRRHLPGGPALRRRAADPGRRPAQAVVTQLEYETAVELGKPVYVFVAAEDCPPDHPADEPEELLGLQLEHVKRVVATDTLWMPFRSMAHLTDQVRVMRFDPRSLAEGVSRQLVVLMRVELVDGAGDGGPGGGATRPGSARWSGRSRP